MKTIHKAKKCRTCKKVVSNGVMLRTTANKGYYRKNYYCNSECFGPDFGWAMFDDLIEYVKIEEVKK